MGQCLSDCGSDKPGSGTDKPETRGQNGTPPPKPSNVPNPRPEPRETPPAVLEPPPVEEHRDPSRSTTEPSGESTPGPSSTPPTPAETNLGPAVDVPTQCDQLTPHDAPGKVTLSDSLSNVEEVRKVASLVPAIPALYIDVEEILDKLRKAGTVRDQERARIFALRDGPAIATLHWLQMWIDENSTHEERPRATRLLLQLSRESGQLPPALFVQVSDVQEYAIRFGGFADVYRGKLNGESVALKRPRLTQRGEERIEIYRKLCRESLTWRQLKHQNILRFVGLDATTWKNEANFAMVAPWMNGGTIWEYIKSTVYDPKAQRHHLLEGVALGLVYLHANLMIHGDLHELNVFITKDGHACLADFGLTAIGDSTLTKQQTVERSGASAWIAPELLEDDDPLKTPAGDTFAYGRMCLLVVTVRRPFEGLRDERILVKAKKGDNPWKQSPSPEECQGVAIHPQLWDLANRCWASAPQERPQMVNVLTDLQKIMSEEQAALSVPILIPRDSDNVEDGS